MQGKRLLLSMISGLSLGLAMTTSSFAIISLPCGWYAEGNVGYPSISDASFPDDLDRSTGRNIAGNLNIGYKFMPYFALEVGGSRYPNTNLQFTEITTSASGCCDVTTTTNVAKIEHWSVDVAAKGIIPIIDSGFELFAKVGVARSLAKLTIQDQDLANDFGLSNNSNYATGVYLGVGGQWYFVWPELAANIQWQRADGNNSTGTYNLYSVGLSFIFY